MATLLEDFRRRAMELAMEGEEAPWFTIGHDMGNPDEIPLDVDLLLANDSSTYSTEEEESFTAQTKELPFESVSDVLDIEPEWFNELEGDDAEENNYYEQDDAEENSYYEQEDDGLGWYPDGVKRTLTDEQIAIFRHTELFAIERRRQLRQTAKLDAANHSPNRQASHNGDQSQRQAPGVAKHQNGNAQQASLKESAQQATPQQTEHVSDHTTHRTEKKPTTDAKPHAKQVPYDQRHKRKWESYIQRKDAVQGSMTHRRIVRELDEQKSVDVQIDYGEDETAYRPQQDALRPTSPGRRAVSYADD